MLEGRPYSVDRLPTLTEVLELGQDFAPVPTGPQAGAAEVAPASSPPLPLFPLLPLLQDVLDQREPDVADAPTGDALVPHESDAGLCEVVSDELPLTAEAAFFAPAVVDVEQIVALVLQRLRPHVDELLQERLAEVLAPVLAQTSESLIRDSRVQLSATLRDLVQESLAQVLRDCSRTER